MKLKSKQLRKIIREEKNRFLRETVADMREFQDALENASNDISDRFGEDMMTLFDEDPAMFDGHSTKAEWQQQVTYAQQELDTGLVHAMEEKIQEIETMLHDGQYQTEDQTFR
jgi:hypothetical protein